MLSEGTKFNNNRWVSSAHPHNSISTGGYSAGDLIGTKMTFADVIPQDYGGGSLVSIQVIDKAKQSASMDLILFTEDLNSGTGAGTTWATGDDAALVVADSDLLNVAGVLSVGTGDYSIFSANSVAVASANVPFYLRSRNLYGLLVARGSGTFTSIDDIVVSIGVERDSY